MPLPTTKGILRKQRCMECTDTPGAWNSYTDAILRRIRGHLTFLEYHCWDNPGRTMVRFSGVTSPCHCPDTDVWGPDESVRWGLGVTVIPKRVSHAIDGWVDTSSSVGLVIGALTLLVSMDILCAPGVPCTDSVWDFFNTVFVLKKNHKF